MNTDAVPAALRLLSACILSAIFASLMTGCACPYTKSATLKDVEPPAGTPNDGVVEVIADRHLPENSDWTAAKWVVRSAEEKGAIILADPTIHFTTLLSESEKLLLAKRLESGPEMPDRNSYTLFKKMWYTPADRPRVKHAIDVSLSPLDDSNVYVLYQSRPTGARRDTVLGSLLISPSEARDLAKELRSH